MSQNKDEDLQQRKQQCSDLYNAHEALCNQIDSLKRRFNSLNKEWDVSPKVSALGALITKLNKLDETLRILRLEYVNNNAIYPDIKVNLGHGGQIVNTSKGESLPGTDEMSADERYQEFQKVLGKIITESNLLNDEDMKQHRGEKWYVPIQECLRKLFNICQTKTEKILTNVAKHGIFEPKAGNLDPTEDAQHRHVPGK